MTLVTVAIATLLAIQDVGVAAGPAPDRLAAAYMEAFNARDSARLARLFAEDAVLMPPETPVIRGRAAIEAAYRSRFALALGRLDITRLDFDTHGDRATVVGTFTLERQQSGDPAVNGTGSRPAASGKFIVIYRRVQNQWLIAFQIANYDSPQPE